MGKHESLGAAALQTVADDSFGVCTCGVDLPCGFFVVPGEVLEVLGVDGIQGEGEGRGALSTCSE